MRAFLLAMLAAALLAGGCRAPRADAPANNEWPNTDPYEHGGLQQ
jgi:hypothetical protein